MTALRHTWQVALRYIRALLRQPAWVGISLIQPVIWLLLFGALFKRTADARASPATPMSSSSRPGSWSCSRSRPAGSAWASSRTSTAGRWTGCSSRRSGGARSTLAASPNRFSSIVVQSVVVIGLALVVGAHFEGGVAGVAVLVALAGLLGAVFASRTASRC